MSGNLLVVIVEVNATSLDALELQQVFNDVIVFSNSHLLMSQHNKLVFSVCHQLESVVLFSSIDETEDGDQIVTNVLPARIKKMFMDITEQRPTMMSSSPLLSGALAKSLCYIHRYQREKESSEKLDSRILVVKCCSDSSSQYMTTLSAIFAAQKENVIIDACTLKNQSGYMQQAADITGGLYYTLEDVSQLLQHLVWMFLPDPACRAHMTMPVITTIDYRAACFCHHKMVDVGHVCSVCLSSYNRHYLDDEDNAMFVTTYICIEESLIKYSASSIPSAVHAIFCQFNPICSTCKTHFKLPNLPVSSKSAKAKKKKKQ